MTIALRIAPVRKSLRVNARPEHAFEVFTAGLGRWWPLGHGIGPTQRKGVAMETRLGGSWYETAEDGTETNIGKIVVWEPPRRFVMTWDINSQWKPDKTVNSEVEVQFIPDGAGTRLELEHRNFERLGAEGGEKMRKDVDGGWPAILEQFKNAAEKA